MESDKMLNVHGHRRKMNDYSAREAKAHYIAMTCSSLPDKKMDTVDSQILDRGRPQRLIDPPIFWNTHHDPLSFFIAMYIVSGALGNQYGQCARFHGCAIP
jgi:hypothetical protein